MRGELGRFDQCSTTCGNSTNEGLQGEGERIVPRAGQCRSSVTASCLGESHERYDKNHTLRDCMYGCVPGVVAGMYRRLGRSSPLVQIVEAHLTTLDDSKDFGDSSFNGGLAEVLPHSVFHRLLILLQKACHLTELLLAPFQRAGDTRVEGHPQLGVCL